MPTTTPEAINLQAILDSAPTAPAKARKLPELTDAEIATQFEATKAQGATLRAQAANPTRNGHLAANTTRMNAIVADIKRRLAERAEAEATEQPEA
jgi:hypothetical protein